MNEDYSSAVKILISFGLDEKQATEAVDKIKDLGKETKKGGEMAEHANVHHREMRELFTHMNKLVPGLGEAMHAAFAGPIGPLILLGIAIGGVQEVFKKYNEELDKVSADQIKEHTAEIGRVKSAWDGAQQAIGKYYAALATAGEEKDPIEKALANIKAVESAQIESSKKIIEALGKQEVAFLRAQGASPDQIAAAEQRNAERTEREDARKEYGEGVGGLQAEQAARQAADARLKAEAEAANREAVEKKNRFDAEQAELAKLRTGGEGGVSPAQANLDRVKKVEESFDAVASLKFMPSDVLAVDAYTGFNKNAGRTGTARQQLNEDLAAAQTDLDREKKRVAQLEQSERERAQQQAEAETRAQAAQTRSTTNRARLRELPGELAQAGTIQHTRDQGRAIVDTINERDAATGETLGEMGAHAQLNQSQIIEIARRLINGQMTHAQEIQGLKNMMGRADQMNAALHQQAGYNRF